MIKIISGTYGHRKNGRVVPVNSKSGPVELDKKEEARLVAAGVAEYVESEKAGKPEDQPEAQPTAEDLEKMTVAELKAMAEDLGLEVKGGKKADYIEALTEATGDDAEGQDEGTPAPTFGGDTVVD